MNTNCSPILRRKLEDYMEIIDKKARKKGSSKKQIHFWPAAVVGCEKGHDKRIGESGKCSSSQYHSTLVSRLLQNGPIGVKVNGNYNGCCAEPHAANLILQKYPFVSLTKLIFTPTIRPRTRKKLNPCPNCSSIF